MVWWSWVLMAVLIGLIVWLTVIRRGHQSRAGQKVKRSPDFQPVLELVW